MTGKNRGGRPPKPPGDRKSEKLRVRVTDDEYDRVCRAAIRRGQSISDFLRDRLRPVLGGVET